MAFSGSVLVCMCVCMCAFLRQNCWMCHQMDSTFYVLGTQII